MATWNAGARIGDGVDLIGEERIRQVTVEGWTPEHDDRHTEGDLCDAACAYAAAAQATYYDDHCVTFADIKSGKPPRSWPWEAVWWKPSDDPIRNLVKAGALIAAEIDRLQRRDAKR